MLVIYPMIVGFSTSVHEQVGTIGTPSSFVGAENYSEVLKQPSVGSSTVQTVWYVLAALVLESRSGSRSRCSCTGPSAGAAWCWRF